MRDPYICVAHPFAARSAGLVSVAQLVVRMSASKRRRGPPQQWRQPPPRPPYIYNRLVRDGEFLQRVRRHIPASLVPLVARHGAACADDAKYMNATSALYAPWVLAEVTRASLIKLEINDVAPAAPPSSAEPQ
jgi:hypothetical protein